MLPCVSSDIQHPVVEQTTGPETQISHNNPQLNDGNSATATGGDGGSDGAPSGSEGQVTPQQESPGKKTPSHSPR